MASTFVEFRDPQPSFVRPIDATGSWIYNSADVTSPTRSHGPRSSRASNQSRATYSQSALAPPPRPLDIPTPAPAARGAAEPSDNAQDYHYSNAGVQEADADEYVGIDIADIEIDNFGRTATTKRKKGFVGGFVSNLRRLPRAVARNLVHERQPQSTIEHFPYPSEHGAMPYDQPTGTEEAVPPYSSPTSPQVHYDSEATSTPQPHQTPLQPARPAKWPQGPTYGEPYYSHRSTKSSSTKSSTPSGDPSRTSFPPTIRNPDPDSSSSESSLTETNHPMASVRPIRAPLVPQDDDPQPAASSIGHSTPTQARPLPQPQPPPPTRPLAVHIDSGSPTYHEPPRAADYGRMESPIRPPEEPPLSTQLARLGRFFQTLNELPWFASTIATDFIPAESGRARRKHASNASWYASKHRDVDLLAGGSSSRVLLGAGEHQVPHASSGTLPMYAQASRASVDNLRNQPRMAPTYPAQYPYPITPLPPPPPLYFYPSPAAQAEGATVEIRPQPAYPLYLVGVPSTASYISSPEPGHHSPPPPIHIHSPQYGVGPAPG